MQSLADCSGFEKEGKMINAEIKLNDEWRATSLEEAVVQREKLMRCTACHGPVYAMLDYSGARKSKFVHLQAFSGCGESSGGIPLRHPSALK